MHDQTEPCGCGLDMYDGEYEGECELEIGHRGAHWDGLTSWRTSMTGDIVDGSIDLPEDRRQFTEA